MNRRYILFILVALATAAFGQRQRVGDAEASGMNPRLSQLEEYLQQHSHGIQFDQINDVDDIIYAWYAQVDSSNAQSIKRLEDALDTIRIAFASVSKDAKESYRYEYHQNGSDTIRYSAVFSGDAYEVARFRYEDRFGRYSHSRHESSGLSEENQKPFDIAAFEAHIQPALEPLMKLQGVKSYPVHWQHDKGYEDEVGSRGNLLYGVRIRESWPAGLTTGTYYFIPAQHQAKPIFDRLDSLAYDYVNRHPEHPYAYHHIPIIIRIDNRYGSFYTDVFYHAYDIVESDDDDCDETSTQYNLRCFQDDDGLHILSLTTKGILWIPKGFQKMKRWVNGKASYRKN